MNSSKNDDSTLATRTSSKRSADEIAGEDGDDKTTEKEEEEEEPQGICGKVRYYMDAISRLERLGRFREVLQIQDQLRQLERQFADGEYYAFTSAYIEIDTVTLADSSVEWNAACVREIDSNKFVCRYAATKSTTLIVNDPYSVTREGVTDDTVEIPTSNTARDSTVSPSDHTARCALWPTDIFGNDDFDAEIAHLIPAGAQSVHKDWYNVAAAVCGFSSSSEIGEKKKAARGYIPNQLKDSSNDRNNESKDNEDGDDNDRKKTRPKQPLAGAIHFVSNKMRFKNQKKALDGSAPTCLVVPVMTLANAKLWRGEGYKALCFVGLPRGSAFQAMDNNRLYKNINLTDSSLLEISHTRDATRKEIEDACAMLRESVLALHSMIANLSQDDLDAASGDNLEKARQAAKDGQCKVPILIGSEAPRKPVCLVTFGNANDSDKHPPPDPLCLALKAANVFGIMSGMKMLGIAEDCCDYDIRDAMEEEAFLQWQQQANRPKTWEDLARGLGQPHGYRAHTEY